jgi:acyl-CoA oxidase
LLTSNDGAVIGVEYTLEGTTKQAYGPVILATGGYGADFSRDGILAKVRPDLLNLATTNGDHCTGDGIKLANEVGGASVDLEFVQVHPTGLVDPSDADAKVKFLAAEALRGVGGLLLDGNGQRFVNEMATRDHVSEVMGNNKGPFRLVLNGKASKEIEWHCKHYVGRGLMKKLTGVELAKEIGISPKKLEETYNKYNQVSKKGIDEYGKKFFQNLPYSMDDTFHVAQVCPLVHYCMGGVKISTEGEVVNEQDKPVPGLFACGEIAGGVHGKNRLGGSSLTDCVVYGRVSGGSAAQYLLQHLTSRGSGGSVRGTSQNSAIELSVNQVDTKITLVPSGKNVSLNISWDGQSQVIETSPQEARPTEQQSRSSSNKYYTDDIRKPNNPVSLQPLQQTVPSNKPSRNSGGTADVLPNERKKATFEVQKMTAFLHGGEDKLIKRDFIKSPIEGIDFTDMYNWDRPHTVSKHVEHFIGVHKKYKNYKPTREEIVWMLENTVLKGSLMNHHGLFVATLNTLCTDEQKALWMPKAFSFEMIGCYAQTELGHGSNVRGLQTIATYDKQTQEIVLNTPTLTSIKWWPGTLGKICTHAAVYAELIIDDKEYGLHVFMVQVRDENHRPLPGIEVGDLGPKLGDNANDTGFLRLENVRIPREHMFSKYQEITKDGKYVKSEKKTNPKLHYATMMFTRGMMVGGAAAALARASTIAIRYSCVRRQGFSNPESVTFSDPEYQIIDYQVQRYRLFRQLSLTYVLKFVSTWMVNSFSALEGDSKQVGVITDTSALPELAATSAGMKAIASFMVANGIEDLRKCCGGNGYLMSSGIAPLAADYVWQTTAEGDFVLLILLTGRFLLKSLASARKGPLSGPVEYLNVIRDPDFDPTKLAPQQPKSVEDLMNLDYLLSLFKFRALTLVLSVGAEIQKRVFKGQSQAEAWNSLSLDMYNAVRAHCLYFILEIAIKKTKEAKEPKVSKAVNSIVALFANSIIMDDNWAGLLTEKQFRLVREAVALLLDQLRPDAVTLVDAFDLDDNVVNSTIGRYDGNIYEALYEYAVRSELNQKDPFEGYYEHLQPHLDREFLKHGNKVWNKSKL